MRASRFLWLAALALLACTSQLVAANGATACVGECASTASLPPALNGSLIVPKYSTPVTIAPEEVGEPINVAPVLEKHRDVTVEADPQADPSSSCSCSRNNSSAFECHESCSSLERLQQLKVEMERVKEMAASCDVCNSTASVACDCPLSPQEFQQQLAALKAQLLQLDTQVEAGDHRDEGADAAGNASSSDEEAASASPAPAGQQEQEEERDGQSQNEDEENDSDEKSGEEGEAQELLTELRHADKEAEEESKEERERAEKEEAAQDEAELQYSSSAANAPADLVKEGLRFIMSSAAMQEDAEGEREEAQAEQQQASEEAEQKAIDAMKDFEEDDTEDADVEEGESAAAAASVLSARARELVAAATDAVAQALLKLGEAEKKLGLALGAKFQSDDASASASAGSDASTNSTSASGNAKELEGEALRARAVLELRQAQLNQASALYAQQQAQTDDIRISQIDRAVKSHAKEQADKKSRAEHMLTADSLRLSSAAHRQRAIQLLVEAGDAQTAAEAQVNQALQLSEKQASDAIAASRAEQDKQNQKWQEKLVEAKQAGDAKRRAGAKGTAPERKARRVADKTLIDILTERSRQASRQRRFAEEDANTHERQAKEDERAGDEKQAKIERALQEVEQAKAEEKAAESEALEAEIEEEEARQRGTRKDEKLAEAQKDLAKANVREKEAIVNEKLKLADVMKDKLLASAEQQLIDEAERRAFVAERKLRAGEKEMEEVKLELTDAEETGDVHRERKVEGLLRSAAENAHRLRKEWEDALEKVSDMKETMLEHEQDEEDDRKLKASQPQPSTPAAPSRPAKSNATALARQQAEERQKLRVLAGATALEEQDIRLLKQKLSEARAKNDAVWANVYEVELRNAERDAAAKRESVARQLNIVQGGLGRNSTTTNSTSSSSSSQHQSGRADERADDEDDDEEEEKEKSKPRAKKGESLRDKLFNILNEASRKQFF